MRAHCTNPRVLLALALALLACSPAAVPGSGPTDTLDAQTPDSGDGPIVIDVAGPGRAGDVGAADAAPDGVVGPADVPDPGDVPPPPPAALCLDQPCTWNIQPWACAGGDHGRRRRAQVEVSETAPEAQEVTVLGFRPQREPVIDAAGRVFVLGGTGGSPSLPRAAGYGPDGSLLWLRDPDKGAQLGLALTEGGRLVLAQERPDAFGGTESIVLQELDVATGENLALVPVGSFEIESSQSEVVVALDGIYTTNRVAVYLGALDDTAMLLTAVAPGKVRSPLAVGPAGEVLWVDGDLGSPGLALTVSAADGSELVSTALEDGDLIDVLAAPVVGDDGAVHLGYRSDPNPDPAFPLDQYGGVSKYLPGGLHAWTRTLPEASGGASPGLLPDGDVLVSHRTGVLALDGETGEPLWTFDLPGAGNLDDRPIVTPAGRVVVAWCTDLVSVDQEAGPGVPRVTLLDGVDGAVLWEVSPHLAPCLRENALAAGPSGEIVYVGYPSGMVWLRPD